MADEEVAEVECWVTVRLLGEVWEIYRREPFF